MRGDRTFAYDLDMAHGAVNSRVVLLLRSIEAKPRRFSPVLKNTPHLEYKIIEDHEIFNVFESRRSCSVFKYESVYLDSNTGFFFPFTVVKPVNPSVI
jgi:hypothetical protein